MSLRVSVSRGGSRRDLSTHDLPLGIGPGEAQLRRASTSNQAPALLEVDGDRVWVVPGMGGAVFLNDRPLTTPTELKDGDRLVSGGTEVCCSLGAGHLDLEVHAHRDPALTRPPGAPVGHHRHGVQPRGGDAPGMDSPLPASGQRALSPAPYSPGSPRRRPRPWWRSPAGLMAQVALLALGVLAWFVFTASFVRLEFEPEPESYTVRGLLPGISLEDGYLLRPGTYRLTARLEGYRPLDTEILVTEQRNQTVSLRLEKLPGHLALSTVPVEGAQVLVDGEARGTTPLTVRDLSPGAHALVVRLARYREASTEVRIEGLDRTQSLELTLVPAWAQVALDAEPTGSVLWVDGESLGPVPARVELLEGAHSLELRAEGHKTWRRELSVVAGEDQDLGRVVLEPADGTLNLVTRPAGANVTVNERYAGQSPLTLTLAPRVEHRIAVSKAGYREATRTVDLAPEEERALSIPLDAVRGVVDIDVRPKQALVRVNGRPRGRGSQRLTLLAVPHTVEVALEGYVPYRARITPRKGYTQELRVRLRPKGGLAAGEVPRTMLDGPGGHRFRLLEPGEFTLGASRREQGRRANETLRPVKLSRPFYLATREVTNGQFRRFDPGHNSGYFDGLDLNRDDLPVTNVSWEKAAGYCNWLSEQAGITRVYEKRKDGWVAKRPIPLGFRLPTEAEWAWAARFAGRSRPVKFPWGDRLPPPEDSGNYADRSVSSTLANTLEEYDDGYASTAPTGKFNANPVGIFDLGGNVAEWTHDYYTIYSENNAAPPVDPTGPESGKHHVIRGSSWMHASISALRLSYRDYGAEPRPDVGFRCARYLR